MSRKPRTPSPTDQYHVIIHGDTGLHIFQEERACQFFQRLLSDVLADTPSLTLYAYCISEHRANLVIQSKLPDLSLFMKRICTAFAIYYNKSNMRTGHVFQSRYQSTHIESKQHLIQTIKFIHNLPTASQWSSQCEYKEHKPNVISQCALDLARHL